MIAIVCIIGIFYGVNRNHNYNFNKKAVGFIAKLLDFVVHNILYNIVIHNSLKKGYK